MTRCLKRWQFKEIDLSGRISYFVHFVLLSTPRLLYSRTFKYAIFYLVLTVYPLKGRAFVRQKDFAGVFAEHSKKKRKKPQPDLTCYVACEGQVRAGGGGGGLLGCFNSIDLSFDKPSTRIDHMADSKSLSDFFPHLQITIDKLMTHTKSIVIVPVSRIKSRTHTHTRFSALHV